MDRLTDVDWREKSCWAVCEAVGNCAGRLQRLAVRDARCAYCKVLKLYARLAKYEDTGLEPEEIAHAGIRRRRAVVRRVRKCKS